MVVAAIPGSDGRFDDGMNRRERLRRAKRLAKAIIEPSTTKERRAEYLDELACLARAEADAGPSPKGDRYPVLDQLLRSLDRSRVVHDFLRSRSNARHLQDSAINEVAFHTLNSVAESISTFRTPDSAKPAGQFKAWMFTIAKYRLADYNRHEPDGLVPDVLFDLDDQRFSSSVTNWIQANKAAREVLDDEDLPPRYREVLILLYIKGLSLEKAAEEMKTTVDGIRGLRQRAYVRCRDAAEARQQQKNGRKS